jgi:hypothetical protein
MRRLKALEQNRERQGQGRSPNDGGGEATGGRKGTHTKWWTERGSGYYINDDEGLEAVIHYVCVAQERQRKR